MPGWFDLYGLDESSPEDVEGFAESSARIEGLIAHELSLARVPLSRIAICGFSQGGALALHVSLRYQGICTASGGEKDAPLRGLAGCAALSAW